MPDTEQTQIALMAQDLEYLKGAMKDIKKSLDTKFVSQDQFDAKIAALEKEIAPLKKIIYGMAASIMLTVLGAVLATVII